MTEAGSNVAASLWPDRPKCHDGQRIAFDVRWRDPAPDRQPAGVPFRTCSYCGSIHPEDLHNYLTGLGGVRLGGADWKYGWPHKFYVEGIPNPLAGQMVQCGSKSEWAGGKLVETPIYSPAPESSHAKWYNEHLLDLSPEAFALLAPLLHQYSGIEFWIGADDGKLHYRAPYRGYQR